MRFLYVAAALVLMLNLAYAGQFIGKGYFLYNNLTVGNVGEIVVATNTTANIDLIVMPSSDYGSFINGAAFTTIYNNTVGTGIYRIQVPQGSYTVVAQAISPTQLDLGVVTVPIGQGTIFGLNGQYKYYFNLTNYSKVYVTLMAAGDYANNPVYVNLSGSGATVNPEGNLDTLNISENRGLGNVTLNAQNPMEMFIYVNYTPQLVSPLDAISPGNNYSIGVASYGLYNVSKTEYPYQVRTDEVIGVANITALSAYNQNPPVNSSVSGASLQLNVGLNTHIANKLMVFWLQDVVDFNTTSGQYYLVDNIWNNTNPSADLTPTSLAGSGNLSICSTCTGQNFYVYSYPIYYLNYSFPFNLNLVILENQTQNGTQVNFGYQILRNGTSGLQPLVFFDRVLIPGSSNTTLLTTPFYQTPGALDGSYYDTELVFGGEANGANAQFNDINSALWIYYKNSTGAIVPFPSVYTFGLSTAETATGVYTASGADGALVLTGRPNYATDIFAQNALSGIAMSIANTSKYTTVTTTVQPIPVNPFQGSTIPTGEIDTFVAIAIVSILFIILVGFFLLRKK